MSNRIADEQAAAEAQIRITQNMCFFEQENEKGRRKKKLIKFIFYNN